MLGYWIYAVGAQVVVLDSDFDWQGTDAGAGAGQVWEFYSRTEN
jgi:hypothetical protein